MSPTGDECPTLIACMYCRFFHVYNPFAYIAYGNRGYECRLPKELYLTKDLKYVKAGLKFDEKQIMNKIKYLFNDND